MNFANPVMEAELLRGLPQLGRARARGVPRVPPQSTRSDPASKGRAAACVVCGVEAEAEPGLRAVATYLSLGGGRVKEE